MRIEDGPLAICIADIHATAEPPSGRKESKEEWLQVQQSRLIEVGRIASNLKVPLLIAGDIFHTAEPPPEIVNLMIEWLEALHVPIIAIPGNHDLLYHRLAGRQKTAYGTLERAGVINALESGNSRLKIWRFGYGKDLANVSKWDHSNRINIALVHAMVWKTGFDPYTAIDHCHVNYYTEMMSGYDFIVFGDNHKAFTHRQDGSSPWIVNCGCFIQRRLDELDYHPAAWILSRKKGVNSVKRVNLGNERIKFRKREELVREIVQDGNEAVGYLVQQFEELSRSSASFLDELTSRASKMEATASRLKDHILSVVERAKT